MICLMGLLAQLREHPTLWTHLFHLMFYRDLSPVSTMFMTLHFWSEHFFSICLSLMILLDMHSSPTSQIFDIDDDIA